SADGRTQIHAIRWMPEGEPKAILQIVHGMVEFIARYEEFAEYLNGHGYIVCGEDHLGHGESVATEKDYGYFGKNGNDLVITDIHRLRQIMQEHFPDVPYLMLGHSMGSFLLRQYLTEGDPPYAEGLQGTIVMGTGWQPTPVLKFGRLVSRVKGRLSGGHSKSRFIDTASFGSNLKRIDKPRTKSDWLTKDEEIVDRYEAEPWCQFSFTVNGYYNMFKGIEKAQDKKRMAKLPQDLPMLLVSGAEDPVGNYGEGVRKTYIVYQDYSPCTVDIKLYDDDRHEILNETDREDVYRDLLEWMEGCLEELV
ncbi:MAG: alpha/beta fold hydrolase, partial [Mogibacterium sp.]|nr:alpha/beta fold hydrolase [Mogibacterium sp.]